MAKLFVKPDGTVAGVYSDEIDYREIGTVDIQRASEVEWDAATQSWGVLFRQGGQHVTGFKKREEVLAFEVGVIEAGLRGEDVQQYIIQEELCRT